VEWVLQLDAARAPTPTASRKIARARSENHRDWVINAFQQGNTF